MLFNNSTVSNVTNLMALQASSQSNEARKLEHAKALDLYHSQGLSHLEQRLAEVFSEPDKFTVVTLNVIRKIINQQAQTFREPAKRTIEGSEADHKLYSQICEGCNLDLVLKKCSQLVKLLKSLFLKVVFVEDKLRLDVITGNLIQDVQTYDSPYDLKSVLIIDYGQTNRIENIEYSYWDADFYKRLDYRYNILEEFENPYNGRLPFVPLFDSYNISDQFFQSLDDSLISLQEAINEKLTDLLFIIRMQGFGVGWIRTESGTGGSLQTDPGTLIELKGEKSAIGFESQESEIESILSGIDKIIKWTAISQGLSAASMSTDPTEQSGLSKIVDTRELSEMRIDDKENFRMLERNIFSTMRTVWNAHSNKKLSESATLSIDFADIKQTVSGKEQAQADDLKMAQGVLSPVDVLLRENPDITDRETAMSHLLTIKDELKELTE
jgi:hypothetical protein